MAIPATFRRYARTRLARQTFVPAKHGTHVVIGQTSQQSSAQMINREVAMLPFDCKSPGSAAPCEAERVRVRGFSHVIKYIFLSWYRSALFVEDEESLLVAVSNGPVSV